MKMLGVVFSLCIYWFGISSALAANCYAIQDKDARAFCLAREGKGSCYSIQDKDRRSFCLAGQGKGSCYTIKDHDLRARCLAAH